MRIAIIGLADVCLSGAPKGDSDEWDQRWHMGQDLWAPATDVFEMHPRDHWSADQERLGYLRRTDAAVWTRDFQNDIPNNRLYPIHKVEIAVGRRYFECTAAYMLGLAISLAPEAIGLWGISGEAECREQRPNLEYLIGLATGRGIEVRIGEGANLLTSAWRSGIYGNMDPSPYATASGDTGGAA